MRRSPSGSSPPPIVPTSSVPSRAESDAALAALAVSSWCAPPPPSPPSTPHSPLPASSLPSSESSPCAQCACVWSRASRAETKKGASRDEKGREPRRNRREPRQNSREQRRGARVSATAFFLVGRTATGRRQMRRCLDIDWSLDKAARKTGGKQNRFFDDEHEERNALVRTAARQRRRTATRERGTRLELLEPPAEPPVVAVGAHGGEVAVIPEHLLAQLPRVRALGPEEHNHHAEQRVERLSGGSRRTSTRWSQVAARGAELTAVPPPRAGMRRGGGGLSRETLPVWDPI